MKISTREYLEDLDKARRKGFEEGYTRATEVQYEGEKTRRDQEECRRLKNQLNCLENHLCELDKRICELENHKAAEGVEVE